MCFEWQCISFCHVIVLFINSFSGLTGLFYYALFGSDESPTSIVIYCLR